MRKIVLALTLALGLSGCAGPSIFQGGPSVTATISNPVTPAMLYEVENGMVIAVSGLLAYRNACANGSIPPSCRAIIAKLQVYTRRAKPILVDLRTFIRRNDNINAVIAYNEVVSLIGAFKSTAIANGVR